MWDSANVSAFLRVRARPGMDCVWRKGNATVLNLCWSWKWWCISGEFLPTYDHCERPQNNQSGSMGFDLSACHWVPIFLFPSMNRNKWSTFWNRAEEERRRRKRKAIQSKKRWIHPSIHPKAMTCRQIQTRRAFCGWKIVKSCPNHKMHPNHVNSLDRSRWLYTCEYQTMQGYFPSSYV